MYIISPWTTTAADYIASPHSQGASHTAESVAAARKFLIYEGVILGAAAMPALYALSLRKKRKLKPGEERLGVALENASNALGTLTATAIAAPVVAAGLTYITVQKMEDAELVTKGLGDAVQTLLAVSAAGPAIAGITNAASAFAKKGK